MKRKTNIFEFKLLIYNILTSLVAYRKYTEFTQKKHFKKLEKDLIFLQFLESNKPC